MAPLSLITLAALLPLTLAATISGPPAPIGTGNAPYAFGNGTNPYYPTGSGTGTTGPIQTSSPGNGLSGSGTGNGPSLCPIPTTVTSTYQVTVTVTASAGDSGSGGGSDNSVITNGKDAATSTVGPPYAFSSGILPVNPTGTGTVGTGVAASGTSVPSLGSYAPFRREMRGLERRERKQEKKGLLW